MDAVPHAATTNPHAETSFWAHEFTNVDLDAAESLVMLSESCNEGVVVTGFVGESEEGDFKWKQKQKQKKGGAKKGYDCNYDYNYKNNNQESTSPSSSSSTVSSVSTRRVGLGAVVEVVDEELTGPWARSLRYRPIDVVYSITRRMDQIEENNTKTETRKRRKMKKRKKGGMS